MEKKGRKQSVEAHEQPGKLNQVISNFCRLHFRIGLISSEMIE